MICVQWLCSRNISFKQMFHRVLQEVHREDHEVHEYPLSPRGRRDDPNREGKPWPESFLVPQPRAPVGKDGEGRGMSLQRGWGSLSTCSLREEPGQGRADRLGARAYSGFSGHRIRQRLSRKRLSRSRAAAPGRLSPRKKSCRPLRGRDSGPGPGNGGGGGLTEAPRASAWRLIILSSSPQVSGQRRKHGAFREESFWHKYWLHIEPSLFRRRERKPGGRNREAELQDPLLCLRGCLGPWRGWWEVAGGGGRRQAEAPGRDSGSHHTGFSPLPVPALPPIPSPPYSPKRQAAEAPASPGSRFHSPPAPPLLSSALGGTSAFLSDLAPPLSPPADSPSVTCRFEISRVFMFSWLNSDSHRS